MCVLCANGKAVVFLCSPQTSHFDFAQDQQHREFVMKRLKSVCTFPHSVQVWHALHRKICWFFLEGKAKKSDGAFWSLQTVHRCSVFAGLHSRHIARLPSSSESDLRATIGNSASVFSLLQIRHSARWYSLCNSQGEHHDTLSAYPAKYVDSFVCWHSSQRRSSTGIPFRSSADACAAVHAMHAFQHPGLIHLSNTSSMSFEFAPNASDG